MCAASTSVWSTPRRMRRELRRSPAADSAAVRSSTICTRFLIAFSRSSPSKSSTTRQGVFPATPHASRRRRADAVSATRLRLLRGAAGARRGSARGAVRASRSRRASSAAGASLRRRRRIRRRRPRARGDWPRLDPSTISVADSHMSPAHRRPKSARIRSAPKRGVALLRLFVRGGPGQVAGRRARSPLRARGARAIRAVRFRRSGWASRLRKPRCRSGCGPSSACPSPSRPDTSPSGARCRLRRRAGRACRRRSR